MNGLELVLQSKEIFHRVRVRTGKGCLGSGQINTPKKSSCTDAFEGSHSQLHNCESNFNNYLRFKLFKLSKLPELSAERAMEKEFQLPFVISWDRKWC